MTDPRNLRIERCRAEDLPAVRGMLVAAGLPEEDLDESLLEGLLVAHGDGELAGAIGLQTAGRAGLLRSLVVAPEWRGRGLGAHLVAALEREARARGIERLYLLTDTAPAYFPKHGYRPVDRDDVPEAIAATAEFRELCPASAICLSKVLV